MLTTHRLLVFTLGGFFVAAPKKIVHDLPFAQLASISQPIIEGSLARVLRVAIGLADGTILRWEFPRLQINDGIALIEELDQHLPAT